MEQNLKFHKRTVSIADILGEQWVVVLYYAPLLTPACAHWNLVYQRPEFICQTCFERFPTENVTMVMSLEELTERVTAHMFAEYARAKNELRELEQKLQEWESRGTNPETGVAKNEGEENPTKDTSPRGSL
jgi:hypothetical protein